MIDRRDGIGGPHHLENHPGLPPDFRDDPACFERHETEGRYQQQRPEQRTIHGTSAPLQEPIPHADGSQQESLRLSVPITILVNDTYYFAETNVLYTMRPGRSGRANSGR